MQLAAVLPHQHARKAQTQTAVEAASDAAKPQALTEREQDILLLAALGNSNKHIARRMNLSVRTVESHRTELRRKLGIGTAGRLEAMMAVALRQEASRVAELLGVDEQTVEHQRSALRQSLLS